MNSMLSVWKSKLSARPHSTTTPPTKPRAQPNKSTPPANPSKGESRTTPSTDSPSALYIAHRRRLHRSYNPRSVSPARAPPPVPVLGCRRSYSPSLPLPLSLPLASFLASYSATHLYPHSAANLTSRCMKEIQHCGECTVGKEQETQ
ncbi:uncharacterized protein BDZ99DRAFT_575497 [Mytilinidion resinicola]|uniref:Uncharacterized protein n=1 Tax=Mytilinidion resinicola TaxID=574789 RepID=A0A6A6Y5R2_9PEZI|nr:uncharacterized protein BDZ99DRAFT_575497 [Mytilinidion resinicola]KAF2804181.1 hypothetical protein BDZ99DRAFT_575497 [Mytilinidion resinicola]